MEGRAGHAGGSVEAKATGSADATHHYHGNRADSADGSTARDAGHHSSDAADSGTATARTISIDSVACKAVKLDAKFRRAGPFAGRPKRDDRDMGQCPAGALVRIEDLTPLRSLRASAKVESKAVTTPLDVGYCRLSISISNQLMGLSDSDIGRRICSPHATVFAKWTAVP
jgi:hypothetical protein